MTYVGIAISCLLVIGIYLECRKTSVASSPHCQSSYGTCTESSNFFDFRYFISIALALTKP